MTKTIGYRKTLAEYEAVMKEEKKREKGIYKRSHT